MSILRHVHLGRLTEDPLLVGGSKADAHLPRLTSQLEPSGSIVLDFDGIDALTSSYFFRALLPFWTREDADGPCTFPLVANASADVEQEISHAMTYRRHAAWSGGWNAGMFSPRRFVGVIDDAARPAIETAIGGGLLTAVELSKLDGAKPTAWNNRLAELHRERMLLRRQSGRTLLYYAPWIGGIEDG